MAHETISIARKTFFCLGVLVLFTNCMFVKQGYAQGFSMNTTGALPDTSAMLDIASNSKGLLIPRVHLSSITDSSTISHPAISLLVYNTNTSMTGGSKGFWYWNGTRWIQQIGSLGNDSLVLGTSTSSHAYNLEVSGTAKVSSSFTSPTIIGGTGTTSSLTYKTTTGNGTTGADHIFKVGNNGGTEAMRILNSGNVGIGTTSPSVKLQTYSTTAGAAIIKSINDVSTGYGSVEVGANTTASAGFRTYGSSVSSTNFGNSLANSTLIYSAGAASTMFQLGTTTSTPLIFGTNNTERIRVLSGGNVGIGTATPASKVDIEGGIAVGATYSGTTAAPTNGAIIEGLVGIGTSSPSFGLHVKGNYPSGFAKIERTSVNNGGHAAVMSVGSDARTAGDGIVLSLDAQNSSSDAKAYAQLRVAISSPTASSENGILEFWVTNSGTTAEKMRITNTGNVGIGTTSPGYKLDVQGAGTGTVTINTSGDIKAAGTTYTSDRMFKTNIDSLRSALSIIQQLRPQSYYFDTTKYNKQYKFDFSNRKQYGFIAQDIEAILPELVSYFEQPAVTDTAGTVLSEGFTYRSLNYNAFIPILTKGVQELQTKVDVLEAKRKEENNLNLQLQQQIEALTQRIQALEGK